MNFKHPMRRKDDVKSPRFRKGMFILPSIFTCGNIAAGYYAISQTIQGSASEHWHYDMAAKAIGFAILFDGLDGRIARMTNTASDFGRELDSLADVIAFGVAPAILAWIWGFHTLPPLPWDPELRTKLVHLGAVATFIFLVAGASRLARFNIQKNPAPSNPGRPGRKYFVGMPIPAGAGMIAAIVHFFDGKPVETWWFSVIWIAFVISVGFLMVSTWRFWSAKEIDFHARHRFQIFILLAGFIALAYHFSQWVLFLSAIAYMLSGVFARLSYALRRRPTPPTEPYPSASHPDIA
jgi:CDP-diacylglycerol---serine O-phosphatidyltransferase